MKTKPMNKIGNWKSEIRNSAAFTLMELLVVITIIGVLAAFLFSVASGVGKNKYVSMAKAEMGALGIAIESYHDANGFYPQGGPNSLVNPLYFELLGTTKDAVNYTTLDTSAQIKVTDVPIAFPGVSGFVNCTKGSGEDASPAKNYLPGLKPQQIGLVTNNGVAVTILIGAAGGPDQNDAYPFGATGLNPWRYKSPGTYNPNSYDLWMQLVIGGKTNLVCNWSKQVQINFPLP